MELLGHLVGGAAPALSVASLQLATVLYLFVCYVLAAWVGIHAALALPVLESVLVLVWRAARVWFWDQCLAVMERSGVEVVVSGDPLTTGNALLLANHVLVADHLVVHLLAKQTIAAPPAVLRLLGWWHYTEPLEAEGATAGRPDVFFFSWLSLWSFPSVRAFHHMLHLDENWSLEPGLVQEVFGGIGTSDTPDWVVCFPETNVWSTAACQRQNTQARVYCQPPLSQVLYPRCAMVQNAVEGLRSKVSKVYDLTIRYEQAAMEGATPATSPTTPSLVEVLTSPVTVYVHVEAVPMRSVPARPRKLHRWLEKRWFAKERALGGSLA